MNKVDPESLTPNEKGLSFKKKAVIALAVAAGAIITGVVLYASSAFSSRKPDVSSIRSDNDALEALVANLPPAGKLDDKVIKKLTTAFDRMTPTVQIENLKNPKVAQAVLGNKIPLKVAKMDAKQKQELQKDLVKIQNDPNTPDEVKKAAKELQETITEIKITPMLQKKPPGGGGGQVDNGNDSGSGAPPPINETPTNEEGGESGKKEDSGKSIPPPEKPTGKGGEPDKKSDGGQKRDDASMKSEDDQKKNDVSKERAEVASLLAKSFNGPKDVVRLLEELNKGILVKFDGTKYVIDDIKNRCSIEPLIRPLLEAADLKALPKLDDVRSTITEVQKELKEISDATIKSFFKEFDHADDKSTLVAHLIKDLESLKEDNLAARFALLQFIDPVTFTEEYATTTLLKGALNMSSEDLAITFKDELDQHLADRKALIALIDKTKDVDKMVAEAEPIFNKMDNTLKTLVKFDVLEPTEVKKALEVAGKINKAVEEDIKKKCKIEAFIGNLLNSKDSLPIPEEIAATKDLVREMRAKISSLPDTDNSIKSLYEGFLKDESGTSFNTEDDAIEACLEKDIETLTGDKLCCRYALMKHLNNAKYDSNYARKTILRGALDKTPEDLAKVPDIRNFLTQRQGIIDFLNMTTGSDKLVDIMVKVEVSMLTPDEQVKVEDIHHTLSALGKISIDEYEYLKKMLTDKELKISDHKGEQLTLENLAEKCSMLICILLEEIRTLRKSFLNDTEHDRRLYARVNEYFQYIGYLETEVKKSHADILNHHNLVLNTDLKKQEESIFAKDASKLKGDRLVSRYIILYMFNDALYNAEYAMNTLIGNFTKAELKSDPAKLINLYDKVELCSVLHYRIDGEDVETVLNGVTFEMRTKIDNASDKQTLFNAEPTLLKAALLGLLGPITLALEGLESKDQYVTKNLDAVLGDMADWKELVKNAITLQTAINSLDVADASSGLKYAKALAEYLKCEGTTKFPVQKKSDLAPYIFKELVDKLVAVTEKNDFFGAIINYDDVSFERIMNEKSIHDPIKEAVLEQISSSIKTICYKKDTFDMNVELLKRILMKEPPTTDILPILDSVEGEVNRRIALHYMDKFTKALCKPVNIIDEAKFKSAVDISHTMNFKLVDTLFKYDTSLVLLPLLAYLADDAMVINFSAETFDEHVPVKRFLNHVSTNSDGFFESFTSLVSTALEENVKANIRNLWLHKLLVPTFDLLQGTDFFDLEKLPNEAVDEFHNALLAMGDQDHDITFKTAYLEALTNNSNKNKDQNILYLWGLLDKDVLVSSKRKQLESLKLANISNENIIKARERLLTKKTEEDATLKALYKTHYEALKKMYSGPDRDVQFPNNW